MKGIVLAALTNGWAKALAEEFNKDYYKELYYFIKKEYTEHVVYPESKNIFAALELTDIDDVRVVILGQDPYHEEGQAHGLCFSVQPGIETPPSLKNIYREIEINIPTLCEIAGTNLSNITNKAKKLMCVICLEKFSFYFRQVGCLDSTSRIDDRNHNIAVYSFCFNGYNSAC